MVPTTNLHCPTSPPSTRPRSIPGWCHRVSLESQLHCCYPHRRRRWIESVLLIVDNSIANYAGSTCFSSSLTLGKYTTVTVSLQFSPIVGFPPVSAACGCRLSIDLR